MTEADSFGALAHTMAMGTWSDGAQALITQASLPVDERAVFARYLSDDDHIAAAQLVLDEAHAKPSAKRELIHAGDDLAAHTVWIMETLKRLEQNDPQMAKATRAMIVRLIKA